MNDLNEKRDEIEKQFKQYDPQLFAVARRIAYTRQKHTETGVMTMFFDACGLELFYISTVKMLSMIEDHWQSVARFDWADGISFCEFSAELSQPIEQGH